MGANKAAWLKHKQQKPFEIDDAPMPEPSEREVIIRNHAVAINPCDVGVQELGIIWPDYPMIIGSDVAGEVVAVGSKAAARFKEVQLRWLRYNVVLTTVQGDRVIGTVEQGGFQLFSAADMAVVAKLPNDISYTQGSVLPLCLSTAAVSLFHHENLNLPKPQLDVKPSGKVLLVWGASSVVGSCALQMAKAAGFDIAAVAGEKNAQYCKDLGAKYVFDHKQEGVVDRICSTLRDIPFAGVFTAIIDNETTTKCAAVASSLGQDDASRVVGTVLPPSMPFSEPVPNGVRIGYCRCCGDLQPESKLYAALGWEQRPLDDDVAEKVWGEWLTPALERGIMRCLPEANVVGKGLESVQAGCDRLREGVSAMKIVVEI